MKNLAARNILRRKIFPVICRCLFVLLLTGLDGEEAAAQASKGAETKAIHLGLVSEINKTAIEEQFRDFVGYVSRRIAPGSESDAKVIIAPTPFEMARLLEQRRV
ncbi:MAG TPA: hypothetical protein VF208_07130, partial [Candidatus Binatia bacterium]